MLDRDSAFCRRRARVDSGASAPATVTLDLVLALDSERGARLSPEDAERSTAAAAATCCAGLADSGGAGSVSAPGGGTAAVAKGDATRAGDESASSARGLLPACEASRGTCVTVGRYSDRTAVKAPTMVQVQLDDGSACSALCRPSAGVAGGKHSSA